ncbi:sirohydrochlorin cobaltochelatase [Clostridium hydrogenum]|uniref:sirohydrochlorin cobaltochelatase n=1 Tax=Clostridium hydrogenum TaxID=2855764 RepID=UPI002E31438D|nr:sirohydrochlorin cobaltochelatase [Clostridium hydrogenum]
MKKAILVVSFGTTYADTRKLTIEAVEKKIKDEYMDYEVRRAFTSKVVIKILKNRDGIFVDTPGEALEKLYEEGYEVVYVQPLHLIPGSEYNALKELTEEFKRKSLFKEIKIGTPAIYKRKDYESIIEVVKDIVEGKKAVVFMGHGSYHYSNACYSELQTSLWDKGYKNVFIGTVEGYPSIENVLNWIKENNIKEVTLAPFMLVAGDHAQKDMCGEEDSWKSILEKQGIKVDIYLHGLGELEKFQKIYLEHLKEII